MQRKNWCWNISRKMRYLTKEIPHGMCMNPVEYNQPSSGKDLAIGIAVLLLVIIVGLFSLSKNDGLLSTANSMKSKIIITFAR